MSHQLCISIRGTTYDEVAEQMQRAALQANLVEWRLDGLAFLSINKIQSLLSQSPVPMILTLRRKEVPLSEEERLAFIEKLAAFGPAYLDLEYDVVPDFIHSIQQRYPHIQLIISKHAEEMVKPEELFISMPQYQGVIYKGVLPEGSSLDGLRMLLFLKNAPYPCMGFCLGVKGQAERILGPIFGSAITYAALSNEEATAPGQVTADALADIYRISSLNKKTKIFALLGDPVQQSIGHIAHNRIFHSLGIDAVYVKIVTPMEDLQKTLLYLRKMGVSGCSVTMPLKEAILPMIERLDPLAEKIGAVNTISFIDGKILGKNTDGEGAMLALEKRVSLQGSRIVILGVGGAARSVAFVAKQRGANVVLAGRHRQKTESVAKQLGVEAEEMHNVGKNPYDILINATPAFMPICPDQIHANSLVMDMTVRPKKTSFLIEA